MRIVVRLLLGVFLAASLGAAKSLEGDNVTVTYQHMTPAEAADLFARAVEGYAAVTRYLGTAPKQKIIVRDTGPDHPGSGRTTIKMVEGTTEAVAPIEIRIPLRYLRSKPFKTAMVHELTHAVAGVSFKGNAFLAEGLAVHVHGVLARRDESDSFVNFPIHALAQRHLRKVVTLDPLQHLMRTDAIFRSAGTTFASGYSQETGYVFAGSFVTWLIQRDGPAGEAAALAKFLAVYRDGDFAKAFGAPLVQLERAWITYINKRPAARSRAAP